MSVYKIYDVNDASKFYIGSTKNFNNRKKDHRNSFKTDNQKLYKYIRANGGWDCFNMEVIEECLNYKEREIELIKKLKPPLNTFHYDHDHNEYQNKYRKENRERSLIYKKNLYHYKNSWGGDYRRNNNLLLIKMDLFD